MVKRVSRSDEKHMPCGFCYHIVCFDDEMWSQEPVIYRAESEDEDVSRIFVERLERDIKKIHKEFNFSKKMIFTDEERLEFNRAEKCWICDLPLNKMESLTRSEITVISRENIEEPCIKYVT